jgi:hypothetical protein
MKKTILFDHHNLINTDAKLSLPALINKDSEKIPKIFRDFDYPISSWPIILPENMAKELADCCVLIPKLAYKIPELYFQNDLKKIADFYFKGDQMMAQYAIISTQKEVEVSCRLDLIQATSGFKVLEINAGSSIGGMEFQNFEPIINDLHPELIDKELGFIPRKTQKIYVNFIIEKVLEYVSKDIENVNIFLAKIIPDGHDKSIFKEVEDFYNGILRSEIVKYGKSGSVSVGEMSHLKLKNNELTYNDKRIDAVLMPDFALKEISPDVFRAFMMNKIYFPDHLGVTILRDKRNLALLRKLATAGKFSASENEQILKYIPWSVLMEETTVSYKGEEHQLITLLKNKKDEFVIKVADGLQGNDVFIGKFLSVDTWLSVICKSLVSKKYLAQEFIISEDLIAPNKNNEWKPHALIWGAFGFGDTFGGVWVRMSDIENNTGAINSATGAVEVIVYETVSNTVKQLEQENEKQMLNTILGNEYEKFTSFEEKPALVDPASYNLPEIFKDYEYPVSSWPVIIEHEEAEMLEELCVRIPKLIQKIPAYYFENNMQRIADFYFNGDAVLTEFVMMAHQKQLEITCRLDLTLTNDGFKILEANIGSSIGGWQIQSFEHVIRKFHPALQDGVNSYDLTSKNTQQNYMMFLVDNLLKKASSAEEEINMFVSLGHEKDAAIHEKSEVFFNQLFQEELHRRGLQGQAYVAGYKTLNMKQGKLYMNNSRIHGVIIMSLDREEVPLDIFRSFLLDSIYYPDHLGTTIYGDKRNLELLRTLAEQQRFSDADNELVLKSIPWTKRILKNAKVIFKGKEHIIGQLLKKNKDNFVIKAAKGFQGKDVFIGKFSSGEEWLEAIHIAEETGAFIAQEFCDSSSIIAPNKNNEWTAHKLIWGAFGFGKNYGGVWVRMSEEKAGTGVINSATGAVEAIVYEKMSPEILII